MPSVLLATCADLPDGDEDAPVLTAALGRAGVSARWAVWTDPHVDWDEATVVVRSTWDYHRDRERFLHWARRVPRIANRADVLTWNTDKTYLRDIAAAGVPVVESDFVAPGEAVAIPSVPEIVVKPSVGAGSRGAGRFTADRFAAAAEHAAALHTAGRTVVVQPYLDTVEAVGETALLYFDGRYSHAIRKGPMLPGGAAHPVDGWALYVEENITPRTAEPDELEVGAAALAAVRDRFGADQLYARVDLLRSPDGPVVTELELTEPSMFLLHDMGGTGGTDGTDGMDTTDGAKGGAASAADRFAAAIARRL